MPHVRRLDARGGAREKISPHPSLSKRGIRGIWMDGISGAYPGRCPSFLTPHSTTFAPDPEYLRLPPGSGRLRLLHRCPSILSPSQGLRAAFGQRSVPHPVGAVALDHPAGGQAVKGHPCGIGRRGFPPSGSPCREVGSVISFPLAYKTTSFGL